MNPFAARIPPRPLPSWRAVAIALPASLFAVDALALDVARPLTLPAPIGDGVLEAGGRRLHLPPGDWVLTGRAEVDTVGHARGGDAWGRGVSVWAALVERGRLRALVWLSLPLQDFRNVRQGAPGCADDADAIERLDLSRQLSKPECLAVYGERSLQAALATRSPHTLRWLARQHVADPGPLVRFVYKLRSEASYGSLALVLPTGPFDSDEQARRWALGLRDATRAFLEHRDSDASLPALPPAARGAGRRTRQAG